MRLLGILLLLVLFYNVTAQTIDESFQVNLKKFGISEDVYSVAWQPDGKMIIGGGFPTIAGTTVRGLARINANGSLDLTFNASAALGVAGISKVHIQADGKILAAGSNIGTGGSKGLIRVNSNGSLDATFNPTMPGKWVVRDMVIQPDGKILVAWSDFAASTTRWGIDRFHADGTQDLSFNCALSTTQTVTSIALQGDGKILAAGDSYTASTCLLKRFNADGSDDTAFNAAVQVTGTPNGSIRTVSVTPAGDILISGNFSLVNGTTRKGAAMITSTGQLKASFNPDYISSSWINHQYVIDDNTLLFAGKFSYTVDGKNESTSLIQLNASGTTTDNFRTLAGTYHSNDFMDIITIARDPAGKLMLMGSKLVLDGVPCAEIARINTNNTLDLTFRMAPGPELSPGVYAVAVQNDSKVVIGGQFNYVDNVSRNNIARINFNGSLDNTFDPGTGINGEVYDIKLQPDGKILVAGDFGFYNQNRRMNIIRLNANGSLDETFKADGTQVEFFYSIALQPDGKIILKGRSDVSRNVKLVRLHADGTSDIVCATPPNWGQDRRYVLEKSWMSAAIPVVVQSNGKIVTENMRFNTDGTVDNTFNPGTYACVVAVESDEHLLIRGMSTYQGGLTRTKLDGSIVKSFSSTIDNEDVLGMYIQPNGNIIYSKIREYYTSGEINTRRMNYDGSIDASFNGLDIIPGTRVELARHADNLLLAAGNLDYAGGNLMNPIVRLKVNFRAAQTITFNSITDRTFTGSTLTVPLLAQATSHLPVTVEVVSGNATIQGSNLVITGTGLIKLKATQAGDISFDPAPPVEISLYSKRTQTVDFTPIADQLFTNGLQVNAVATATSGNSPYYRIESGPATVSGNTISITGTGKITVTARQIGNDNFLPADATVSFYVRKTQAIAFASIPDQILNGSTATVALSAQSDSGLGVSFALVSGPATVAGNQVTINAPGKVTVVARQIGNDHFLSAEATVSFYAKKTQAITFASISDQTFNGSTVTVALSAQSNSGLDVSFALVSGPATVVGNQLRINAPGKVSVMARQAGNDQYVEATDAIQTFCTLPQKPTISLDGDKLSSSSASNNQWFRNGTAINGATHQTETFSETGSYAVQVTVDGCASARADELIITGSEESTGTGVRIYPNPAPDVIRIELNDVRGSVAISLYSTAGKAVAYQTAQAGSNTLYTELAVGTLSPGFYVLELVFANRVVRRKVAIE